MTQPETSDTEPLPQGYVAIRASKLADLQAENARLRELLERIADAARAVSPQPIGLDQTNLIRACMQLARRLEDAGVPGTLPSALLDAARWLEAHR